MRIENTNYSHLKSENHIPYFIDHEDFVVHNSSCLGLFILPTFNDYFGSDGGYIAIYTWEKENVAYSVGHGINAVAQVRVKGYYSGRIFIPEGYRPGDDIARDPELISLCRKYLPEWDGKDIWIDGDTGSSFGLQGKEYPRRETRGRKQPRRGSDPDYTPAWRPGGSASA